MRLATTGVGAAAYRKLITYLNKNHPIPKANIEVRLIDQPFVPFTVDGRTSQAWATFGLIGQKAVIKIAVSNVSRTLKDSLEDICHEYRHCMQYFLMRQDFSRAANYSYSADPKEIDAKQFARQTINEYLNTLK